jgi:signal transduction histidine kinase
MPSFFKGIVSREEGDLYRALSLGAILMIVLAGEAGQLLETVPAVSEWSYMCAGALYVIAFSFSCLGHRKRVSYQTYLTWGGALFQMIWALQVGVQGGFAPAWATLVVLNYAFGVLVIGIRARKLVPVNMYLICGYLIAAVGVSTADHLETSAAAILGGLGAFGFFISIGALKKQKDKSLPGQTDGGQDLSRQDKERGSVSDHLQNHHLQNQGGQVMKESSKEKSNIEKESKPSRDSDISTGPDIGDSKMEAPKAIGSERKRSEDVGEALELEPLGIKRGAESEAADEEPVEPGEKRSTEERPIESVMLRNMDHEIRTPLTSIIGFSDVIGEKTRENLEESQEVGDEDSEEAIKLSQEELQMLKRYGDRISKSGRRLQATLEAILNLWKLDAGKLTIEDQRINLPLEINEALQDKQAAAQRKEKDITVHRGERKGPLWAQADKKGVGIVLESLISNAIKYTEKGGDIWVRAFKHDDENVGIEVRDNGIGMDPDNVDRLFEPFRQASEGLDREYEGSGVGLAITKKAVDTMNGSITVNTEKGEGTQVLVHLPIG